MARNKNRHKSRESALETLYAWHSGENDSAMLPMLLADRIADGEKRDQDEEYLRELVNGVVGDVEKIDAIVLGAVKGRSLRSIAQIELNVLRLAIWEMQNRLEIPYRVIINEALELTNAYADESARGFVNGVLDKLARELRAVEVRGNNRPE